MFATRPNIDGTPPGDPRGWLASFVQGFLISASNPKVILFYIAFLPTFMDLTKLTAGDMAVASLLTVLALMLRPDAHRRLRGMGLDPAPDPASRAQAQSRRRQHLDRRRHYTSRPVTEQEERSCGSLEQQMIGNEAQDLLATLIDCLIAHPDDAAIGLGA